MSSRPVSHEVPASLIFPVAYGNEQETGMQAKIADREPTEPFELAANLYKFTPRDLNGKRDFLNNGFRLYIGGSDESSEPTNIERATPECATPDELTRYIRAGGILIERLAANYAQQVSADGAPVEMRIQDRVVDSKGSRKGCHDNFGLSQLGIDEFTSSDSKGRPTLTEHLNTRHFVTGAGYVRKNYVHYSQKANGLKAVNQYSYGGTMYRIDNNNGTPRLEVRCSDVNISDWATWMRIGSTALVIAIAQTPAIDDIVAPRREDYATIHEAKVNNRLRLKPDGTLKASPEQMHSLDFQQRLAETALDKLQLYTDEVPLEYYRVASELYRYCEDYRLVLAGESTIDILADRADWAAKLGVVLRKMDRDKSFGIPRTLGDVESRADDLRYDFTIIQAEDGEIISTKKGYGHKLRDRQNFAKTITPNEAAAAYRRPPKSTRAAIRSDILKNYYVSHCDWHRLTVQDEDNEVSVELYDVRQSQLTPETRDELSQIKRLH